ncbi:MAG: tetratricopeptide repeat protein [Acidobacteriaceae bacterium]|nr:tetratricopeptide repeat protein [Acidobacteriaceae bacterium]
MAEARTLLSTHHISSVETLSYTAAGAPWVYPILSGIVFLQLFHLGGYAAISWFCLAALVATLFLAGWRNRFAALLLLLIATPTLADQMIPRSGLFTVVLAAAVSRILLDHLLRRNSRLLFLLPVLMFLWVNLHTGFLAGLGLMLGYCGAEALEMLLPAQRRDAQAHLRQAAPWIGAAFLATLLNPWGVRIYPLTMSFEHLSTLQKTTVLELIPLYKQFAWSDLATVSPSSSIWFLLAISVLCIVLLALQRRLGASVFLAAAIVACLFSARTQGVFLPIACILNGLALADAFTKLPSALQEKRTALCFLLLSFSALGTLWSIHEIVTDKSSLREGKITLFGAGASWWLPQQASNFVLEHHLPTQLFSNFNLSSYLTWSLGPQYRDFADGRYLPFGDHLVAEQMRLTGAPLDSTQWTQAAERYQLRTIIFPLSRFFGIDSIPLREDCASQQWTPVYLDATAVVFVRNNALPADQLSSLRIDCQKQLIDNKTMPGVSRMERYQTLANASVVYFMLGRYEDAQIALTNAQDISPNDDSVVLLQGQLEAAQGDFLSAEKDYQKAIHLHASDAGWYQLGLLYANEQRYREAGIALQHSLSLQSFPRFDVVWTLAKVQVLNGDHRGALLTLQEALALLADAGAEANPARASIYDVFAATYSQQQDWQHAIQSEQAALALSPNSEQRWHTLAQLYSSAGDSHNAQLAEQKAAAISPAEIKQTAPTLPASR